MDRIPRTPSPKALVDVISGYTREEWGFTGTRKGMTVFQTAMSRRVLTHGQPVVLRHGGAFGADFEVHGLWREICPTRSAVDVWPADEKRAALFRGQERVKVEPVMPPLDRNVEIVKRSRFVFATPHTEQEEVRSGTWHAIRRALDLKLPVLIIWPTSQRLTLCLEKTLHRVTFDRV